jgi:outer membrane murein-binding lipoprotein Lpp
MTMTRQYGRIIGGAATLGLMLGFGLTGCDYWPPALQAQIEQLRGEVQLAAADRTRLENQVKDTVRSRDELQARFDEMNRINRELTTRVASLEETILAERAKVAKLSKPAKTTAMKKPAKTAHRKKAGTVTAKGR